MKVNKPKKSTFGVQKSPRSRSQLRKRREMKNYIKRISCESFNRFFSSKKMSDLYKQSEAPEEAFVPRDDYWDKKDIEYDQKQLSIVVEKYIKQGVDITYIMIACLKLVYKYWRPSQPAVAGHFRMTHHEVRQLYHHPTVLTIYRDLVMHLYSFDMVDILEKQKEIAMLGYVDATRFVYQVYQDSFKCPPRGEVGKG